MSENTLWAVDLQLTGSCSVGTLQIYWIGYPRCVL